MAWEIVDDMAKLLRRRYPRFVYSDRIDSAAAQYIPIFTFHTLEADDFEQKLRYLQANNYRTLTLDQVVAALRGDAPLPPRSVALTIDDGRQSTWTVGYPLLKKYSMVATSYVTPGYLTDGPPRPTLDDVWSGRCPRDEVIISEAEDCNRFMTWSEVETLHASGVIEIEAHTMLHRDIPRAPRLRGFVTPDPPRYLFDLPLDLETTTGWSDEELTRRLGSPIFASAPILSLSHAWQPPSALIERCRKLVCEQGGPQFFQRRDALRQLRREMQRAKPWRGERVDLAPYQRWELEQSKRCLEERLPRKVIRHLCYPKTAGSKQAVEISANLGYASNAWGLLPAATTNRPGADPLYLGRLKHDFIYRLPGEGRHRLARLLRDKARRRLRGNTGF